MPVKNVLFFFYSANTDVLCTRRRHLSHFHFHCIFTHQQIAVMEAPLPSAPYLSGFVPIQQWLVPPLHPAPPQREPIADPPQVYFKCINSQVF